MNNTMQEIGRVLCNWLIHNVLHAVRGIDLVQRVTYDSPR